MSVFSPGYLTLVFVLMICSVWAEGVRINEFMASNGQTLNDGDGNSTDWIELYNPGPGPAELGGWFLTDDAEDLEKWRFPVGTTIPENGFLLVFASG